MSQAEALTALIAKRGRVSVADYMSLCLAHPELGYYNTRDPLGLAGDFITAPEISQMFGELIGVWAAQVWAMMDRPAAFDLIELGPGRGTLMSDLMRAASKLTGFHDAATIRMVEMSPPLRAVQEQTLSQAGFCATWHARLDEIAPVPAIIVANEFFDALPVHQFVKTKQGWHERMVTPGDNGLRWTVSDDEPPRGAVPDAIADAEEGTIFERAPAREAFARQIAQRLATSQGVALIVDYGFSGPVIGDTFQALIAHEFADPLADPGIADLTSHVDFSALVEAARPFCPVFGPLTQAALLDGLGIGLRADALKRARPDKATDIDLALARLVSPDQMGALFKAIAISNVGAPPPFPGS